MRRIEQQAKVSEPHMLQGATAILEQEDVEYWRPEDQKLRELRAIEKRTARIGCENSSASSSPERLPDLERGSANSLLVLGNGSENNSSEFEAGGTLIRSMQASSNPAAHARQTKLPASDAISDSFVTVSSQAELHDRSMFVQLDSQEEDGMWKTLPPEVGGLSEVVHPLAIEDSQAGEAKTSTTLPFAAVSAFANATSGLTQQSQPLAPNTLGAAPVPSVTTTSTPPAETQRFISFGRFVKLLILGIVVILGVALSIRFYRARTLSARLVDSTYWRSAKARQQNRLCATATTIRIQSRELNQPSDGGK